MIRHFTSHPRAVGETYVEHASAAAGFGIAMIAGGLACLLHAAIPALAVTSGSRTIARLHAAMLAHRRSTVSGQTAATHAHYLDGGFGI